MTDSSITYRVMRDPDDLGWVVAVDGRVTHSLPYNTREEAIAQAELLVTQHPGSRAIVDDEHTSPSMLDPAPTDLHY